MPRDGSGVYTLPVGNPVVTNTLIQSTWANTTMNDIASQLNNVFTRDGTLGPTGPFKITDGTIAAPGLAWNSEPGMGWFKPATGKVSLVQGGAVVETVDSSSTAATLVNYYPDAGGASTLNLNTQPQGAGTNQALSMSVQAAGATVLSQDQAAVHKPLNLIGNPVNISDSLAVTGTLSASGAVTFNSSVTVQGTLSAPSSAMSVSTLSVGSTATLNGNTTFNGATVAINGANGLTVTNNETVGGNFGAANGMGMWWDQASVNWLSMGAGAHSNIWAWAFNRANGRLTWNGGTSNLLFEFRENGNFTVQIGAALKPGGGAWADNSDIRIKHDVRDYTHGLAEVLRLRPRVFKFKPETGRAQRDYVGLVFQEADALPEMQSVGVVSLGDITLDNMGTLDTSPLVYALVNAVAQLNAKVESLINH